MKNTTVQIKERENYDVIEITLPNKSRIRIQTSPVFNSVEVTHVYENAETMFIKPMMGNQFEIVVSDKF